jgi:hypothetical protein
MAAASTLLGFACLLWAGSTEAARELLSGSEA